MMSELLCPRCGITNDKKKFIESFCIDCYPVKINCPSKLSIEKCSRCEKIKISGEWTSYSKKEISDFVIKKCKGEFNSGEFDIETGMAVFSIEKENAKVELVKPIILEIQQTLCLRCVRMSGGYFQGIIQLRGNLKKVDKWAEMFYSKLKKRTFIAKEEEKHGGLDIYVGDSKAVVALLADIGIKATITTKLAGVEEGKRYYRTTFLIRLSDHNLQS